MSSNIVQFEPRRSAENPDTVLDEARGELVDCLVLGYDKDGEPYAACSHGVHEKRDLIFLIESFKARLLSGEYD